MHVPHAGPEAPAVFNCVFDFTQPCVQFRCMENDSCFVGNCDKFVELLAVLHSIQLFKDGNIKMNQRMRAINHLVLLKSDLF